MKGIGGASLVVAAGSTKPNGDKYTCVCDATVADIPEWLVDWVIEQQRNYRLALNRIERENRTHKKRAAAFPDDVRERLRRENHPDGFDVFPIDRPRFIRSQAFKLARIGVVGDALVDAVMAQVRRYVEGGVTYCETDRALESIRGVARHAEEMTRDQRVKEMADFYEPKTVSSDLVIYNDLLLPVRRDVMREVIREFPDRLTCDEADELLADGLNLVGVAPYDKRKDRTALYEIRKKEGFEVSSTHWTRLPSSSSTHIRRSDGHVMPTPEVEVTLPANKMNEQGFIHDND